MFDTIPGTRLETPKGHAKVQLFDERGKEKYKAEVDNFVSPRMLRAISALQSQLLFGIKFGASDSRNPIYAASGLFEWPLFNGMLLTDYAGATSPEAERSIKGRQTGHASFRSAQNGLYRGAYNDTESMHRAQYHKFVYDFATSQALGTFQSIYTGPFVSSSSTANLTDLRVPGVTVSPTSAPGWAMRDNATGDIWFQTGVRTFVKMASIEELFNHLYFGQPMSGAVQTAPSDVMTGCIRMGYLYWSSTGPTTTQNIYRAPLTNLAAVETFVVLNATWGAANLGAGQNGNAVYGIDYAPGPDQFILHMYSAGPAAVMAALATPAFAVVDTIDGAKISNMIATHLFPGETYVDGSTLIVGPGLSGNNATNNPASERLWFDAAVGSYVRRGPIIGPYSSSYSGGGPVILPGGDIGIWNSAQSASGAVVRGNAFQIAPAQEFFSRALLEEPVTKLSTQSMKITYEFNLPDMA